MEEKLYRIMDGSYSVTITMDGSLYGHHGWYFQDRRVRILMCGVAVPGRQEICNDEVNDCIVQDVDDGSVTFTRREFLKEIHLCPYCGKEL